MISHTFPPTGGSGVQRTAKFAKYLPQFGWRPLVWSADALPGLPRDDTLLEDLPADLDRRVVKDVHPVHALREGLHRIARRLGRNGNTPQPWRAMDAWLERFGYDVAAWSVPDGAWPWALVSLPRLRRLLRREPVDAIYSTFSPASNHLLAWCLKRMTGLPWVADFRDLWTDNFDFHDPSRACANARRGLQRRFLESADAVIAVSADQRGILAAHVPGQDAKFLTIPNGADPEDFAHLDRQAVRRKLGFPDDRFVLSYVGRFVSSAEPQAIIDGVSDFVRRCGAAGTRVEFRIVGTVSAPVMRYLERAPVQPVVTGYVPHRRAIRETVAADGLLLGDTTTGQNCDSIVPGKLFEYLAAGRPILHVGPRPGAADALITECHAGVTVPPDRRCVAATLRDWWSRWSNSPTPTPPLPGCTPQRFAPYTRRRLTGSLADVLNTLAAARDSGAQPYRPRLADGRSPRRVQSF